MCVFQSRAGSQMVAAKNRLQLALSGSAASRLWCSEQLSGTLQEALAPRGMAHIPISFSPSNFPVARQISDFLEITPRLGQDLSDEFVSLRNAEGNLLQVIRHFVSNMGKNHFGSTQRPPCKKLTTPLERQFFVSRS